jgi:hypothetical protein
MGKSPTTKSPKYKYKGQEWKNHQSRQETSQTGKERYHANFTTTGPDTRFFFFFFFFFSKRCKGRYARAVKRRNNQQGSDEINQLCNYESSSTASRSVSSSRFASMQ